MVAIGPCRRSCSPSTAAARGSAAIVDVDTRRRRRPSPLDAARPARVVGVAYTPDRVVELLETVGCTVDAAATALPVTPPTWRPDLTDPADLVEEVVRLDGYDNVPGRCRPRRPAAASPTSSAAAALGRTLAEAGYVEALSLPVRLRRRPATRSGCPPTTTRRQRRRLPNPLSEEEPLLRTTLLPGLLAALAPQRRPRPARRGPVRARRGVPRRRRAARRRCPAWTGVRTTRRSPRCSAPCRCSRGTWPWR